jgi:hypothetical protein
MCFRFRLCSFTPWKIKVTVYVIIDSNSLGDACSPCNSWSYWKHNWSRSSRGYVILITKTLLQTLLLCLDVHHSVVGYNLLSLLDKSNQVGN